MLLVILELLTVYSQVANKVTGEHNCVMVHMLSSPAETSDTESTPTPPWLEDASTEFLRRFLSLLGGPLSGLHPMLALAVIQAHAKTVPWKGLSLQYSCFKPLASP